MKNLLIYLNPIKSFENPTVKFWQHETPILAKIQIDNSLELGWKKEDIVLVTNFDYEYKGVKALVIGDENFCDIKPTATKINAIITLIEMGIINDEMFWFHDFDAFQLEPITEEELGLDNYDLGISEYGVTTYNDAHNGRLSTGSVFFNENAKDIFEYMKRITYKRVCNEEISLLMMVRTNAHHINQRMKRMDVRYNFATRKRNFDRTYEVATKPIKVIHFHQFDVRPVDDQNDNMAVCVYGKNKLNKIILSDKLIKIFKNHGLINLNSRAQ